MAWLLEPFEAEGFERRGVGKGGGTIELAIGVDREAVFAPQHLQHRLDAVAILHDRQAADLYLDHGVAGREMAAYLVLQVRDGLAPPVPAATHIAKHLVWQPAATASHTATSMVPIPIERSASPPIFSRAVMTASTHAGSRLSPLSSRSVDGSARKMRGINRSRICAPHS